MQHTGNDVIYGGDNASAPVQIVGGYGDDKIFSGADGAILVLIYGDLVEEVIPNDHPSYGTFDKFQGLENDGDDLIDFLDNPEVSVGLYAYGQGGDDKILGGISVANYLHGGDGDDKVWALNPGQF